MSVITQARPAAKLSITEPGTPECWLPIAPSIEGSIGGVDEEPNTSWMVRLENILYNLSNGKMQGTYRTNIADSQQEETDFEHDLVNIKDEDPPIIFAVAAIFTPNPSLRKAAAEHLDVAPVLAELELSFFQLTD